MFSVKWVMHRRETQPVEIENSALQDLDEVVESCQARFPEMRRRHPTHRLTVSSCSIVQVMKCDAGLTRPDQRPKGCPAMVSACAMLRLIYCLGTVSLADMRGVGVAKTTHILMCG